MKSIGVTEFKAHCLQLINEIGKTGESILVTKRGKPAARVMPPVDCEARKFEFGKFRHMGKIVGDIISPLDIEWDALK